jgi:hypothetical protein
MVEKLRIDVYPPPTKKLSLARSERKEEMLGERRAAPRTRSPPCWLRAESIVFVSRLRKGRGLDEEGQRPG